MGWNDGAQTSKLPEMRCDSVKQLGKNTQTRYTCGISPVHGGNEVASKTPRVVGERMVGGQSEQRHFGEDIIPNRHPVDCLGDDTATTAPIKISPKCDIDARDKALYRRLREGA